MTRYTSILAALTLAASLLSSSSIHAAGEDESLGKVAEFSLKSADGQPVQLDDLRGKVWIASFIVTRCPDGKCPQVTQTMRRLREKLPRRADLELVTFTTDPTHDEPDELKRYIQTMDADWLFLTGSEETIDQLLRSFHVRAGTFKPGNIEHSQKLILVDRQGQIRGFFDGLDDPKFPPGAFEASQRKLIRAVTKALEPPLPSWMPHDFPQFNAMLNALAGMLLLLGYAAIRLRQVRLHISCMLTAILVSAVFLTAYLFYHLYVKGGQPTRFSEQAPSAPAWVGWLYLTILGTHTILAIPTAPLALYLAYLGWAQRLDRHVRLARWVLPIWLYVSVTGVVVYWMLYRLYP